ncbi:hypothetical protein H4R34_002035 [Dimargaris verticillata]|uniref:Transcription initiation factor IIF subunit beta n=1 Tax=Dimargaris verticillata TaxID=2761393 RepID=A0A9W8ED92_9FUNG|nr:hypothetical protein H4R34_002035 [Dimargaris verticillata]
MSDSMRNRMPAPDLIDEDSEDLRLDDLETKVWLVKVPKFLAEKWENMEVDENDYEDEDGVQVGTIRIYDQADDQGNNISLLLEGDSDSDDIPKEYNLKVGNGRVNNLYVFSEDDQHNTAMEGTIHHEGAVTPVYNEAYRNIMRSRMMEAGKPTRSVQFLGNAYKGAHLTPGSIKDSSSFLKRKGAHAEAKSARMPKQELLDLLFEYFEEYQYWSLKGLVERTNQPVAFLKEVLKDIAVLNKRGQYAGTYNLRPEFLRKGTTASNGPAPTDSPTADDKGKDTMAIDESEDDFEEVE